MEKKIIRMIKNMKNIEVDQNMNLFEEDVIDSFAIACIIAEIESEFRLELKPEDIVPENFQTVTDIVKMVDRYLI